VGRDARPGAGGGLKGRRTMFGIPFEIGYACWQFGQTIVPSSMWIWTGRGGGRLQASARLSSVSGRSKGRSVVSSGARPRSAVDRPLKWEEDETRRASNLARGRRPSTTPSQDKTLPRGALWTRPGSVSPLPPASSSAVDEHRACPRRCCSSDSRLSPKGTVSHPAGRGRPRGSVRWRCGRSNTTCQAGRLRAAAGLLELDPLRGD
jgi:hypothetical protein